jgi:hypothetical protein
MPAQDKHCAWITSAIFLSCSDLSFLCWVTPTSSAYRSPVFETNLKVWIPLFCNFSYDEFTRDLSSVDGCSSPRLQISRYIGQVKRSMPLLGLALLLVAAALAASSGSCTRPNPDFCCTGEAECAALGVDEPRSCGSGRVCDSNVCLKTECSTAAECADPDAPYCANQVCKSACAGADDCLGAAGGPLCADDGACVGCETNKDCTDLAAPICSPTRRTCEGCRADADCASGVCLAADGVCAVATELIYLREDGVDGGTCPKSAPCRTFAGALAMVSPTRRVIRLLGTQYETTDGIVLDSKDIYLDAESTEVRRTSSGNIITVSGTSKLTLEGIKLNLASSRQGIEITSTQLVRLSQLNVAGAQFTNAVFANAGMLQLSDSKFVSVTVLCGVSTMDIRTSDFRNASIEGGSNCVTHLSRSSLTDTQINAGGVLRAENNVIVSNSATCTNDFFAPITEIHFNTWICRHTPPVSDVFKGRAFGCGSDSISSGNLLAWDSTNPAEGCTLSHSIVPSFATVAGTNNLVAAATAVFVDFLGGDYHLRADSPAKGAAESKSGITVDFDGAPRPNPQGSAPDVGAFEAR